MIDKLLPLTLLVLLSPAWAEIYKCVGPDGTVTFSGNPYCEHRQAYAADREESLATARPEELADVPPGKIMEIVSQRAPLPEVLENIGRFAGIPLVPVALEGIEVKLNGVSHHWLELFDQLAQEHDLDYRQAYDHLYVYQVGAMGETIVHSPNLLRWYQADETWNVVMKNDDILLGMKAYEQSRLKERLPRLVKLVRLDLGEKEAVNEAESIILKKSYSGGVGSGIINANSREETIHRAAREKARRITARRQGN